MWPGWTEMALTKLFQVVQTDDDDNVWKTFRTQERCEEWLNSEETAHDLSDYMSNLTLTIRPIWTNMSDKDIKKLLKE